MVTLAPGHTRAHPERVDDTDRRRWEEPGAYRVGPGLHRIPLPLPEDGLRAVNVYVLEGDGGLTLIDAGWALPASRGRLADALEALSYSIADVRSVLVTHIHRDHYSQGVTLRRESGCMLRIGEGERPSLQALHADEERMDAAQLALLRRHGADDLVRRLEAGGFDEEEDLSVWELPDEWIDDGRSFDIGGHQLTAVHTPGHTRGHLVYAAPGGGVLFTGDHVLPHITPSLGYERRTGPLPLRDYLRSLHAMLELPDLMMLPAHGPVRSGTRERVHELLDHHAERLDACEALLDGRSASAIEVARGLGWTRRGRRFDDLDELNQMLAVSETAAHLDVLASWQRCEREETSGVVRYHLRAPGHHCLREA